MPLVLLTGSVAWRRLNPWLTTVLAVTAFMAFQLASGYTGGGAFEVAAIALNFYLLGRRARGRERMFGAAVVFAYWLVGVVVISYSQPGGSVGAVLGAWALLGGLPFALGRTLETRRGLTRRARGEHGSAGGGPGGPCGSRRGRGATADGSRAARRDRARRQRDGASEQRRARRRERRYRKGAAAMRVVEGAGRDALVELRRIVGVLHRGHGALAGSAAPGLSQLDALVDRARAAGLPVDVRVDGRLQALSPGLDLVAYRVVQEALTNAIKHAGPARARVNVAVGRRFPRAGGLRHRARPGARPQQPPRSRARARRDE